MRRATTLVAAFFLLVSCGSDGGGDGMGGTSIAALALQGVVTDLEGNPIEGVFIISDDATTRTDGSGAYSLGVPAGTRTISALEDGYVSVRRVATVADDGVSWVNFTMAPMDGPFTVDAAAGGTVDGPSGTQITFDADSFVDSDDNAYTGSVDVHVAYLDPFVPAQMAAMPAPLDQATDSGEAVVLESFGVISVDLHAAGTDDDLELADGMTAEIRFPAPSGTTDRPETIPLWWSAFDTWFKRGDATWNETENAYIGEVDQFSSWNLDVAMEVTCVQGLVLDADGDPVPGAYVLADGVDYTGFTTASAGPDGRFCINVRRNSTVNITVFGFDGVGVEREVETWDVVSPVPPPHEDDVERDRVCEDEGTWTVTGAPAGGGGSGSGANNRVACDIVDDLDPCLDGYVAMGQCFAPSGECSLDSTGIVWDNGARLSEQSFYGAGGTLCGTFADAGDDVLSFTNASGQTWSIDSENDPTVVTCPDGTTVEVTDAQGGAIEECTGGGDVNTSACFDNGDLGGGQCTSDSQCTSGQVCCDYESVQVCVIEAACTN